MYLIKGQTYSFSGVSAICDDNDILHFRFSIRNRNYNFKALPIELAIDRQLRLTIAKPNKDLQHKLFGLDLQLSAMFRYSAYCPEAKQRLLALWDKHIGNFEAYKLRNLDQLGYLLCVIAYPELTDFTHDPFTLMTLCEAIITPARQCTFEYLVTLKRSDILNVCLLQWSKQTYPAFDKAHFPKKLSSAFYRFCQRLRLDISSCGAAQQNSNARAVEALIWFAIEPQLIKKLNDFKTVSVNNLLGLLGYARLPYSHWLRLNEVQAVEFYERYSNYRIDDIESMAKETGSSLKKLLQTVKKADDIRHLHNRLVFQINELHRQAEIAQLTDPEHPAYDPHGDQPFPSSKLVVLKGIEYLNTANLLRKEGMTMCHCVGSLEYIKLARLGQINIFHVYHSNQHATLEVDTRTLNIRQLQSFNNSDANVGMMNFVNNWLNSEKKRLTLMRY